MTRADVRVDVLVVLADQWRGQDQGWLGNDEVSTPHLDALAADGVAIECAVANHPVCTPSRGDLLTGVHPHRHGAAANDLPLRSDVPTWAGSLREAGYATTWIGKWHLDGVPRDAPVAAGSGGFERFAGTSCSHDYLDGHYYLSRPGRVPRRVDFTGYEPEVQTRLALGALAGNGDGQPRCVVVSYGPPHSPYADVPDRYRERYDAAALTPRANVPESDREAHREQLAQYYAGISAVDDQLGVLVADLRRRGRLADTLIIVTSDHGDLLGSHGARAKQSPYGEAVRIPLVFHWPERLSPQRVPRADGVVSIMDLAPTLLDLLGLDPLPDADGRSVAAALQGGGSFPTEALIANLISVDEGWRQELGEWRGFVDTTTTYARRLDRMPWHWFDDRTDPFQLDDLAGRADPSAADAVLDRLLAAAGDRECPPDQLLRWLGAVDAWNRRERELHGDQARVL